MSDTDRSTSFKNPYYSEIISYLLSRQQLLSSEFHQECVALFFLQNKLKIKLRTLYLAKQIYIKAQLFSNEYLCAALWIAIKYEQGEKISFEQYQRIVKLKNLTQLETTILNKIDFQLNQPTLIDFLELMIHSESIQHDQLVYALGLIVLPFNINYEPSIIAISLIIISFQFQNQQWQYSQEYLQNDEIKECYHSIKNSISLNNYSNPIVLQRFPISMKFIKRNFFRLL